MAFDAIGNLYVANTSVQGDPGTTVSVFARALMPSETIGGVYLPEALAFDPSGNLYVVNGTATR